MTYRVNGNCMKNTFSVPCGIVDDHIRLASGEQIKVLLMILRHPSGTLNENDIAKALKCSVSDAEDCLQYWTLMGIIEKADGESSAPEKYIPTPVQTETKPAQEKPVIEYSRPTLSEVSARMEESPEIRMLLSELQHILGKTFGYDGQSTFIMLYDRFGLPSDVIYMLVSYCVETGKTGFSYIEAVGRDWSEQEIDTCDKAAAKIESLRTANAMWKKIAAQAGLNNPRPTQAQAKKLDYWTNTLKMDFDMIYYAYEIMSENTGKLSFTYMDKILTDWAAKGFKSPEDVDRARKNSAAAAKAKNDTPASETSYDLDKHTENAIKGKLKYKKKDDKKDDK